MASYTFTNNDLVGVEDEQQLGPPYLTFPRRIVFRNVSRRNVVVDILDNATKGYILPEFTFSKDLSPQDELAVPIDAFVSWSTAARSRFAAMVRSNLLSAFDVAASNSSVSGPLSAKQIMQITL